MPGSSSETGFVKDGHASPGVARQYSGTLGKVGNVQIGVSVHAVTDTASCPLDWRLFLPPSWDETTADSEEDRAHIRVRPANRRLPRNQDGTLPVVRLLVEWPSHAPAPTDYWLSTLPEDTPMEQLVRLGKIRWRIEHDYRELKHGLGLDHFEGRHWLGWHHHTTLVTAAHLFVTEQRLATTGPKARPVV